MNTRQRFISYGLIFSGMLLPALVWYTTHVYYDWLTRGAPVLSFLGLTYSVVCLWRAKQFARLRGLGLATSIGVAVVAVYYLASWLLNG